ncbi:UvrD-helicase domain-containing protein [Actinoplanes sp. SE50/110]|uniref:nuclease-related domain-containing DEAD/DEAH box helicase n=1 Tax=unclassified Actinoplanes TaxID=2626549 RepID=UPI00043A4BC1
MPAGGSAIGRALREREHAAELMRRYRRAQAVAARYAAAAIGEQQVAAALIVLTGAGWTLLVDRRWPGSAVANVDMILVGPGGVFVIDVKNWRSPPTALDGRLHAGSDDRHQEIIKLRAITSRVHDELAVLDMAPAVVASVMVFANQSVEQRVGTVFLRGVKEIAPWLAALPRRLTTPQVGRVAVHLAGKFPAYDIPDIVERPVQVDRSDPPQKAPSLFDVDAIARAEQQSVLARPIESWMTYLHPDQLAIVRRRWNGPARISGAAGTGKTVVGLHRAVWLAQRTVGKILYVTFVKNLPRVQAQLLARLSPAVVDRVEFCSLHGWARSLLDQRGVHLRVDLAATGNCFSRAWLHVGRSSVLAELEPNPMYWQDEITYVIKGRGFTELGQYLTATRPGRRTALRRVHREAAWQLYLEYERLRAERGVHDFTDVLTEAIAVLRDPAARPRYAAVIADEVQDLTLVGVSLLHQLVGDAPNGLLLIGDGQQAVYPGGFRLSDAGIDIRGGRAEVLKVNYRNAADILTAALQTLDGQPFDDIDGTVVTTGPAVETTYHDGRVIRVDAATADEHDQAFLAAVRELAGDSSDDTRLGDAAVLCARKKDVIHYQRLLTRAGIPNSNLEDYDGQATGELKVGTFLRSKGLEFKHVFLPHHDREVRKAQTSSLTETDRLALVKRQLFVGMTRARDMLWIGAVPDAKLPRPRTGHDSAAVPGSPPLGSR